MTERYDAVWLGSAEKMLDTQWAAHALIYHFFLQRAARTSTLDLCCGTGAGSKMIQDHFGAAVLGTDYSKEALAFAEEKNPGPLYFPCDLNLDDELYGLGEIVSEYRVRQCFFVEGAEHVQNPNHVVETLLAADMDRFLVSTPVEPSGKGPEGFHVSPFTPELAALFMTELEAKLLGYMAPVRLEELAEMRRAGATLAEVEAYYLLPPSAQPRGNYLFEIDVR